jgi:hypothetical protein
VQHADQYRAERAAAVAQALANPASIPAEAGVSERNPTSVSASGNPPIPSPAATDHSEVSESGASSAPEDDDDHSRLVDAVEAGDTERAAREAARILDALLRRLG